MKTTDYGPRVAPFDEYLRYRKGMIGLELGVDAGAHAEALLRHLDISLLYLIDPWPSEYAMGICAGRLSALGYRPYFEMHRRTSDQFAAMLSRSVLFDFVYVDLPQDADTATRTLSAWWPRLKPGGVFGYRNYSTTAWPEMRAVLDRFVANPANHVAASHRETGELVLVNA